MNAFLLSLIVFIVTALAAPSFVAADEPRPARRPKKKHASLSPIEDVAGLPRVLLIGDSISMGYTIPVRKRLEGKANVHRIPLNGGPTKRALVYVDKHVTDEKWDLIHFNWGIHDCRHMEDTGLEQVSLEDYEKNLRTLVAKLKGTGAKLIWAASTPIPEGPLVPERTFGDIAAYNAVALRVMEENDIPINDLHAYILPHCAEVQKPRDLHFLESGYEKLADRVAERIAAALDETPDKE